LVGAGTFSRSGQTHPDRLIRAERAIVPVRIWIIAFNSFAYAFLLDQRLTIRWLAYSIIAASWVYAIVVVFLQPYRRYPHLWSMYATTIFDGVLTLLWVHSTGGFASPFYLLFYVTVVSMAVRFNLPNTLIGASLYSLGYYALLAMRGDLAGRLVEVTIRVGYIYTVAVLAGVLAREALAEASGRRAVRRLVAVTSTIAQELDPEVVLARLGTAARELTDADRVAIYLVDRRGRLSCAYREGLSAAYAEESCRVRWSLPVGLLQVPDATTHPALPGLQRAVAREGFHTMAAIPLMVRGEQNGLVTLHRDPVRPFSAHELDVARALADQAAVIIQNTALVTDLRYEAARARGILEAAPGGIIYCGEGQVLANPHAMALFGDIRADAGPEQLAGQLLNLNGEPLTSDELPIVRALAGQTCTGEELIVVHPSGRRVPVLVNAEPIFGADRVIGAVATHQDISAIKDLDRVRDEYVALVSHDLRSPMTAVKLHAEMLRRALARQDLSKEAQRADAILRNAARMARLIEDLVDSTQLESGRMPMHQVPTDLNELLARVVEPLPAQDATRIKLERPNDPMPLVLADSAGIERVAINLISNALKYSPGRSPVVVRLARRGEHAVVSVIDYGPGIRREDQPRVFDKYFRGIDQTKTEGLGLGLYICRLIVDANGGRIWVESEPGSGSTFIFEIPLRAGEGKAA